MPQGTLQERLESSFLRTLQSKVDKVTERPSDWIEKNFWIPDPRDLETGEFLPPGPIRLTEFQRRIVNEALARNADGKLKYTTVVYSTIKKSGKSAVSAAVALYKAYERDYANVYCMANDGRQSEGRLYDPIQRCLKLHQQHKGPLKGESPNKTDVTLSNGSKIEAITVDAKGEAGSQPYFSVYSELWGYDTDAKKKLWVEMTIPSTLFGHAQRWVETYAGESGKSDLLEQLYDTGVKEGSPHPDFKDLVDDDGEPVVWVNESASLFCYWDHVPRMVWQTPEYYCLPLPDKKNDMLVLTDAGWVAAEDVTLAAQLCTREQDGSIEYQYPSEIVKSEYSGDLLNVKTNRFSISMTPNHRVLAQYIQHARKFKSIKASVPVYEYREATEAKKAQHGYIPTRGEWKHDPLPDVIIEDQIFDADDFIELMAWFLSEGCVQKDTRNKTTHYNCFHIGQCPKANPQKYERIRLLLGRLCVGFTATKKGFVIYHTPLSRYFVQFGVSHEKFIPRFILEECSSKQLQLFLDAYVLGDGTTHSSGKRTVYTNSDQLKLDIMELSFKAGFNPRHGGSYSSAPEKGRKPIHHIYINNFDLGWVGYGKRNSWSTYQAKKGTVVWCPVLPNGNFYVCINGVSFWSGNSQESKMLADSEFQRIHRNLWVSPVDTFVNEALWKAVKKNLGPIKGKTPIVLGVDAAISNDYAAVVAATRDPDSNSDVAIRFCYMFTPKAGGGTIKISETIEPLLRTLVEKYNVVCVAYDKYQLEDMAQRLRKESIVWMYDFSQMAARAVADKNLQSRIINKTVWWDVQGEGLADKGSEIPSLYQHITKAGAKRDSGKLRLVKLSDKLKIDGAVAASMAVERCTQLQLTNRENDHFIREHTRGEMSDEEFTQRVQELKVNA